MKKIIIVFLAAVIIATGMWSAFADVIPADKENSLANFTKNIAYDAAFTDISGHWAWEYITNAYEYGIISGVGAGLYRPDTHLTVAQAITIGARMHMIYKYGDAAPSIMEKYQEAAVSDYWAEPYVAYAQDEALITGEWSNLLQAPITRGQTMYIWSNLLQEEDMAAVNIVNSLPDVNSRTRYFEEIALFYEAGIVQGSTINDIPNSFNPQGLLTRAEAAAIFMLAVEPDKRITGQTYGEKSVRIVAGTGTSGFSNEVRSASFTLPHGLAVNKKGGIVVFDTYNNALRLVENGKVSTISGQWIKGDRSRFSRGAYRDGLLADALFNRPTDGVYSASGDLFICDSANHVIRLIREDRTYTFAGTGMGYADGSGSTAKFNTPSAIAIDRAGNLYVADTMNNCIRKVDSKGAVTTIAGTPGSNGYADGTAAAALFNCPTGIAISQDGGTIYVADTGNHVIRKIQNGRVTTFAGQIAEKDEDGDPMGDFVNGSAKEARFNLPKGLALADDVLFVADSGNNVIRAVNAKGRVFTAAGTGEPGDVEGGTLSAQFNQPSGVLWYNDALYIADTTNNMIKKVEIDLSIFEDK